MQSFSRYRIKSYEVNKTVYFVGVLIFNNMLVFSPPESTGEMIALGEYMLNVKNKVMHTLNEEIECSKGIIE